MQQRVAVRAETTAEAATPDLVVVVPTFNERDNIAPLLQKLAEALPGIRWEVVFVDDDSTDGTVGALEQACRADRRVRSVRRLGRRGLASAVVEGIQSSFAPYIAVMDADLQHDERLLCAGTRPTSWSARAMPPRAASATGTSVGAGSASWRRSCRGWC
jgi:dolichol-phosphate mannosyltransferase